MPADVRKALGLPARLLSILGYAQFVGAEPQNYVRWNGSAERFRTSGGRAAVSRFLANAGTMSAAAKSQQKPIVFVVDDDISVRESLELLIKFAGWQPETFASASAFLEHPRTTMPNCLVLDISLPDLNGLELQKLIASERTDMPIIFITGHGDVPITVQAMKGGAVEFLTKPFDDEVLLNAIRHAIRRSAAVLDDQAEVTALRSNYESLTPREQDVLRLVVAGMLNKQIGLKLGISEITVKAHRGKMMQKMKAESLADLVKTAVRLGLVPAKNPWHTPTVD
jgi:FixJ family two-component response regulator